MGFNSVFKGLKVKVVRLSALGTGLLYTQENYMRRSLNDHPIFFG
jgi:hypothetical protein